MHIFLRDSMNFNEIFDENVTYHDIKSDQKQSLTLFRQYIFRNVFSVKAWIFFEWIFNSSFCRISYLSVYLNKNEPRKKY